MWFSCYLYSRCPRIVRQHLNQNFGRHGSGRGGTVNWPARSPDFNPPDLWLSGRVKTLVYSDTITDAEALTDTTREFLSGVWSKTTKVWKITLCLWDELEVVLTCMGSRQSIPCTANTKITNISAGIGFWTFVDKKFCLFEYCANLKSVTSFTSSPYLSSTHCTKLLFAGAMGLRSTVLTSIINLLIHLLIRSDIWA
jgi:hypothetical protein